MADILPKKKKVPSTQQYLPIEEIKEGVVKMKNGSLRAVIMVSSVNFELKSEREKDAMIGAYQNFLNSLNYPIQIMAQSRRTQLDDYVGSLKTTAQSITNPLLKTQIEQYTEFITGLIDEANVMAKRFFVVVSFYPVGVEQVSQTSIFKKILGSTKTPSTSFEMQKMELLQRVDQVINGLASIGLRCVVLNTEDLMELYYTVYNPDMVKGKLTRANDLEAPIISAGEEENA